MISYENLKTEIVSGISPKGFRGEWFTLNEKYIDDAVINDALRQHGSVRIPYIGIPIALHNPIIMPSNTHLQVDEHQILMQGKDSEACLLRNENVQDGNEGPVSAEKRDKNISVEGGIWNIRRSQRCKIDNNTTCFPGSLGSVIFSSVENFSLRNMQIFDSYVAGPAGTTPSSYAIQLSNCKDFLIENIDVRNNRRDGVHIGGPCEFGLVRHIRGVGAGDDLVSLLAWDWYNSGLSFGNISHIWVDDVEGSKDEMRLLPGQKVYPDGRRVDGNIENCIIENVKNLYVIKIYEQHNLENPYLPFDDSSGTVGVVNGVYFKNISFVPSLSGFGGVPLNGLFDTCCELSNCHFEDISVDADYQRCRDKNLSLIKVGPLSYICGKYGEAFNPDSVGTADNIFIKNVTFGGVSIEEKEKLISVVNKPRGEYPVVSIAGKGYGEIGRIELLKN